MSLVHVNERLLVAEAVQKETILGRADRLIWRSVFSDVFFRPPAAVG